MTLERLLAHYETVADAPDAVPRLRRFVLDLAVRGRLVPQDPNDEPVAVTLRRMKVAALHPGAFSIPSEWAWINVGAIADARLGKMLDKAKNKGLPRPYLRNMNVRWFDFDLSDVFEMPFEDEELREFALRTGDVMVCEGGEPGRAAVWDERIRDIYFQKAIHRIRFEDIVDPAFFVNALRASANDGRLTESFTGTGIKHLTGKGLSAYSFPLPPLAEQRRIVARVDELMGLCDRLEASRAKREAARDRLTAASLARLNRPDPDAQAFRDDAARTLETLAALTTRPDQIKPLRQTILNLAVRGKLVEQDPADEPAAELLERLKKAQIAACIWDGRRSRSQISKLSLNEMWFKFPKNWVLSSFEEIFVIVSGVTKGQKVAANEAVEVPYLRVANVQRGYLDLTFIKKTTVRKGDEERYALQRGDVLMTEGGDWDKLGRAAIWNEEVVGCIHQNHVFRVRPPSKDILPKWVVTYVNSLLGRAFFEDASKQTTNLASINMTQLRRCPLPLPPLAEQHRIVAKVDALMTLCDRLEAGLERSAATRRRLLDALLAEALTPEPHRLEAAE